MLVVFKMFFLLSILIIIHEGGHCITAKILGVRVNKFAIGFGPSLFSKVLNDTKYEIKAIPLGGYVTLEGEEELSNKEGSFSDIETWKKILILSAGALINILFGFVLVFVIMTIKQIIENNQDFINSITYSTGFIKNLLQEIGHSILRLFNGNIDISNFSGPIGISYIITNTNGILEYLYILSIISISLGITNLLPIIPLDGGKILIVLVEMIRGKKFKDKTQAMIQTIGLIIIVCVSFIIMCNDIKMFN